MDPPAVNPGLKTCRMPGQRERGVSEEKWRRICWRRTPMARFALQSDVPLIILGRAQWSRWSVGEYFIRRLQARPRGYLAIRTCRTPTAMCQILAGDW